MFKLCLMGSESDRALVEEVVQVAYSLSSSSFTNSAIEVFHPVSQLACPSQDFVSRPHNTGHSQPHPLLSAFAQDLQAHFPFSSSTLLRSKLKLHYVLDDRQT